uniref:COesterase domain-containing protein n=1 Tax=Caenorhabditis japonica TaxID=281687 RepID=A0A8R1EIQ6_CAEJA
MSGPIPNLAKKANFKATTEVAKRLGCLPSAVGFELLSLRTIETIYACLRAVPAQDLLDAQLYILQNTTYFLGAPYVDGEFIIDYPDKLFEQKLIYPINTMLGTTSAELRESK